ncbi:DUF11 domain-containing protein, partial [Aureivirga sp. CE67]|uniref:beta strand repeat-containing protein n=1 Tax=Aureivirga sp. CE67 TaxID=1788983 RepID=UPI0018CA9BA6
NDDTDGNTEDDPTEITISEDPSIEVVKTVTSDVSNLAVGDVVTYTVLVSNTGNVTLDNVSIVDTLTELDGTSNPQTLASIFDSSSMGSLEGILQVGEVATYTVSYTVTQSDIDNGGFANSVFASGDSPENTKVEDTSDDNDDTDGNTEDDPTEVTISEDPSIEVVKTVTSDVSNLAVGSEVTYTVLVSNTGNVTLDNVSIVDTLTELDGTSNPQTLASIFDSSSMGSLEGILQVGEVATYTVSYTVTQSDIDNGGFANSVFASGDSPEDTTVEDISDDNDDADGNTEDDPTEVTISEDPSIEVIKTVTSDVSNLAVGDVVTYSILVSNIGNVTLDNVSIVDTLTELDGTSNPQTLASIFDSSSMGSLEGILQVGEVATYTVSYTVTQLDIDNGGFANSVFASGDSPEDTTVEDVSDDNDDADGNTEDDPTEVTISEDPSIEVVKTVRSDVSNLAVGDVVTYTVLVSNTGNVTLDNVSIVDTLTELDGTSNPQTLASVFDSSSIGSLEGILQVGEVATYTVSYTVSQSDIDNGGFANSVFASGDSPEDTTVEDVSDDNDDADGNTEDDPTEVTISEDPSIEVVKTVTSDVSNLAVGSEVTYTVLVSNTGNVTLDDVSIVDTLTELDGTSNPQTLASIFDSSSMGSLEGILQVGEVATYTVSYTVTQLDIDNGGFANSVFASGDSPEDTTVEDVSDDNDDTDGNTEDDPTEVTISEDPSIEVVKTVISDVSNIEVGDVVTYTVLVSNTGNVTLDNVSIVDTLTELDGTSNPQTLASIFDSSSMGSLEGILQVGEVATYTVSYTVTQSDIDNGGFANSVFASGDSPEDTTVEDVSDDNDDADGNTEDDPTEVTISEDPSIEVVKTVTSDVSNLSVGSEVIYTVLVSNTGNVTLDNVSIVD